MDIMALTGVIEDHLKSINRLKMILNDFNKFHELNNLDDDFNDLNCK